MATYRPIAGHGRANAAALERAGVTTWIRTPSQLGVALTGLFCGLRGHRQVKAGHELFEIDPVGPAVQLLERRERTRNGHAVPVSAIVDLGVPPLQASLG